jgi:hypothetical protein
MGLHRDRIGGTFRCWIEVEAIRSKAAVSCTGISIQMSIVLPLRTADLTLTLRESDVRPARIKLSQRKNVQHNLFYFSSIGFTVELK